ncbi:sugar phosphate nucleotidyltransferase [Pectinatus sottacetonis]|uniref:sugar phosphate nucleotidyltransferase n=1 Tax=Pectinatus sottacetonis TaxID=1002795 RepID=UPI0018C5134B|nr:NDP-sugar synthase [Pectinatus sottacetonis]
MQALFLAGGKGTRLYPLTREIPKPMVPIMGKPLLEHNMNLLKFHGIRDIILSICYKPDYIKNYFGSGAAFGLNIKYITEESPLGTGGAIKNCENYLKSTFFVFNSDILSNINYSEMLRYHKRKNAAVTIAVTRVDNPSNYGVIEYTKNGYANSFCEKPKADKITSHFINAGVYIFEPDVLKRIPKNRPVSIEREVFPQLLHDNYKIAIFKGCNYWLDIGTPEKYIRANQDGFNGKLYLADMNFHHQTIYSNTNTQISRSAILRGPIYIGKNVQIRPGAIVGPRVILGDNNVVGEGSSISNSILWNKIVIHNGVKVERCIITDKSVIKNTSRRNIITPSSVKAIK